MSTVLIEIAALWAPPLAFLAIWLCIRERVGTALGNMAYRSSNGYGAALLLIFGLQMCGIAAWIVASTWLRAKLGV